MALSEHEKQEFEQIQARLLEDDPRFVRRASRTSPAGRRGRNLRVAALLVGLGFALLLGIVVDLAFGIAGFAAMFVGVVLGVRALQTVEGDLGTRVRELLRRSDADG
jgi:hypothetical protein